MKTKLLLIFFISLLTLSLASCDEKTQSKDTEPKAVNVKVQNPTTTLPQRLSHKGKIQSSKSVDIQSRGSSYVERIFVDVGDVVNKNQLLVKLNSVDITSKRTQLLAQFEEVEASLENAERDYERYQNLREKNSVSEKELESIRLKYRSAQSQKAAVESQLRGIESELKYFDIKSPFDGVVTAKHIQEGDLANPQMPILQMEANKAFEFHFSVSEREILALRKGQLAKVEISNDHQKVDAQISEISSSSLSSGGQYIIKAKLLNNDNIELFSGQQGEIQLVTDKLDQGIFVPESALIRRGGLQGLYVLSSEQKAMLRWVEVGAHYGEHVEILSGIQTDESIITSSDSKLYNGINVNY